MVRRGDVVLDVGANYGEFTVLFSNIVGPRGVVHAFEPVPPTFLALKERITSECKYKNVVLNNIGLSDANGAFDIHVPSGDFGQASLRRHQVASWRKGTEEVYSCQLRTLDDYVQENEIRTVNVVKLDVEGAELLMLKGGKTFLTKVKPVLHLEFYREWTKGFGYSGRELVGFLRSLGYQRFFVAESTPLQNPEVELDQSAESINVICRA
jgi:FkbM family methyltransferase